MSPQAGARHLLVAIGVVVALMLVGGAIASLL